MTILIPVIHYQHDDQVLRNAVRAFQAECDGVALIHMEGKDHCLSSIARHLKDIYPDKLIGINFQSKSAKDAVLSNLVEGLDFTWTDDQLTYSHWSRRTMEQAQADNQLLKDLIDTAHHQLFTGVAFKHQRTEPFPWLAADRALQLGFIPTTSGIATGVAVSVSYLQDLRQRMKEQGPLALASGITPENVTDYLGYVSHLFVATGISSSFYEFDPEKLHRLRNLCRSEE